MRTSARTLLTAATAALAFGGTEAAAQEPPDTVAVDTAQAAEAAPAATSAVDVTTAVVATDIQDRTPVGDADVFAANVGTLYFFTVLEGDFGEQRIEHVWLRDGEEVARVQLTARGPRWRTWSSKDIPADWTGDWTVRVLDANGAELESVSFTVGE